MDRAPRIFYAAGPGDVIGTSLHWRQGRDDPSQLAMTYSGQFYTLCRERGASAYVVCHGKASRRVIHGAFHLERRTLRYTNSTGLAYHLEQLWYGLWLCASAIRFQADVAVVAIDLHWFILGLMRWAGIHIIPSLHCLLWAKGQRRGARLRSAIDACNRHFFRKQAAGLLCVSRDVAGQVFQLLGIAQVPIELFLPTYRASTLAGLAPPSAAPPYRVLFVGRIERNKGIFDVLNIAARFAELRRTDIEFDICGEGSCQSELYQRVNALALEPRFHLHGHVDSDRMRAMYESAHMVIVPSTSSFAEGFNKVVAEGVLAGRPVITSSICPALDYVRSGVIEVPADDPHAYGDAILHLVDDLALHRSKLDGCQADRLQFYDTGRSWGAALDRVLKTIGI